MKNIEEYEKTMKNRSKLRWTLIISYFSLMMLFTFLPWLMEVNINQFVAYYSAFTFIGVFSVISVVLYPFYRGVPAPYVPDDQLIKPVVPEQSMFSEVVRMHVIFWLTLPFGLVFLVQTVIFVRQEELTLAFTFFVSASFFFLVAFIFNRLEVIADDQLIKVSLGPLKTKIPLTDVLTVRATVVSWFKDYMGFGKRVGPDGSIGYIVPIKTGVRIERKDGKAIVITIRRTQEFVNFVRYHKKNITEGRIGTD